MVMASGSLPLDPNCFGTRKQNDDADSASVMYRKQFLAFSYHAAPTRASTFKEFSTARATQDIFVFAMKETKPLRLPGMFHSRFSALIRSLIPPKASVGTTPTFTYRTIPFLSMIKKIDSFDGNA